MFYFGVLTKNTMNGTSILKLFLRYFLSKHTTLFEVENNRMRKYGIRKGDVLLVDHSSKPGKKDIGVGDDRELMKGKGKGKVVFVVRGRS